MSYLSILLLVLFATFLVHKGFHLRIYETTKQMIVVNLSLLVIGTLWDSYAITHGHWQFPKAGVIGYIGVMPIEEYLFIFIITYLILVLYHLVREKVK